jgi:NitT/TauT family transport system substrate-binding protein
MPAPPQPNRTRRKLLQLASGLPLLPLLQVCGPAEPLSVASHPWPGYELMFLARDQGWLPKDGIKLLETQSATESIAALREGKAHAAALTLDEVLRVRAAGTALTVVLVFDISAGADVVVSRPDIQNLAELAGKTIGAETSALGALMLAKTLSKAGLKPGDVKVVPIPPEGHIEAWNDSHIDALITYEPSASRLLEQGAYHLLDSRQFPESIFDVLAVRPEAARDHSDALKALVDSHFRGLQQLRRNPQDTAYRIAGRLGLNGDNAQQAFRGLLLPALAQNRSLLAAKGRLLEVSHELSATMLKAGLLPAADALADLVSDAYLPERESS